MNNTIPFLIKQDKVFSLILDEYGVPGFLTRPQGFESMCGIILEQQVSLESARASFNKIKAIIVDFIPENIIEVTEEEFRSCGVSRQKTTYLRVLAEAVLGGVVDFESFKNKDTEQVRKELIQVKGIGNWTIDIYLMFSLQSPDVLPLGDIGILSAIKDLWGFTAMDQIIEHSQLWKPYRTTAAFFLWHYYLEKRGRKFPH
ncbi:DNA-3-methyladenine glycosylase family protein [Flavobacterium cerinum]|uniref:DNA-3-methyladenine glycosylase II n=1 Tax=Flavobacterium cerinum TaxID=2502784 RepID=A0A444HFM5_9FLAO|nr:DNA-3-methyladenine glycosylase [Flavobacterium cerinum]RWX03690.1 DNA-3-methyladenine glycosylase 2 family protein [Flavobacterium cerinum]